MPCPECKDGGDVIECGGELICTQCALVLGSHFSTELPPKWYGTHTIIYKAQFKPENHMEKAMRPLLGKVKHEHYSAMKAVFGRIYKSFFKMVKGRRYFMSYAWCVRQLLLGYGYDPDKLGYFKLKTPSRQKQHTEFWKLIVSDIGRSTKLGTQKI